MTTIVLKNKSTAQTDVYDITNLFVPLSYLWYMMMEDFAVMFSGKSFLQESDKDGEWRSNHECQH